MATYKICIEYDGTPFSGFQVQNNQECLTVQGCLQETLSLIFDEPVKVYGAGRTDTGVHASGQVIHFKARRSMDPWKLRRALNGLLNRSISAVTVETVDDDFHARHRAKARSYVYMLDNSPAPSALMKDRCYWFPVPLDREILKKGAALLEGTHDFSKFTKNLKENENPVRTIYKAQIFCNEDFSHTGPFDFQLPMTGGIEGMIHFYFYAPSFLHSQVRLMVGNLLNLGRGATGLDEFESLVENRPGAKAAGTNIPGRGLYLVKVDY